MSVEAQDAEATYVIALWGELMRVVSEYEARSGSGGWRVIAHRQYTLLNVSVEGPTGGHIAGMQGDPVTVLRYVIDRVRAL